MKYLSLCIFVLVFTLLLVPFYEPIFSYTNQHNVSVSSDEVQFGPAIIQINYHVTIDVDRPSELDPGDPFTIVVYPKEGYIEYTIEILDNIYSIPQTLNLGDEIVFNVIPGIDAYVSTSASSVTQILGPVSNNEQSLRWNNPTSQIIQNSVDDNVGDSEDIVVKIPIEINIVAGLNLNIFGIIKQNIAEKNIGTFSTYPIIEERIHINRPMMENEDYDRDSIFEMILLIIIIISVIVTMIIIVTVLKRRRNYA